MGDKIEKYVEANWVINGVKKGNNGVKMGPKMGNFFPPSPLKAKNKELVSVETT